MKSTRMVPLALVAGLLACDSLPFGPEPPSFLFANLEGEVEAEYRGTGLFTRGHQTFAPVVGITSRGEAPNENERVWFQFYGPSRSPEDPLTKYRPGTGVYQLSAVGFESEPTNATTAGFALFAEDGALLDRFIATSGEVVITRSRSKRIEGRFTFEAVRAGQEVLYVRDIDLSGPRVTVTGTFGANWYQPVATWD